MTTSPLRRFGPWNLTRFNAGTTLFLLDDHRSPCQMWCRFCPHGAVPVRPPHVDEAGTAAVLAAFDEALAATDTPNLFLASMDILDFPGIFAVLDRVRDAGRRAVISTPGLAAADPALVARLAQYPVEMALTWLASDEPTYERVGGRADAHKLIPQAIENLRAAGIPYTLQTVVTSDNVHQFDTVIADVVQRFGQTQLRVHLFYPDLQGQGSSDYLDQFPAMTLVRAALERASAAQLSPRPRLVIGNMPLCQLDLRDLPGLDVVTAPYRAGHNPMGYRTVAACRSCRLVDRCIGVHPSQPERTPMLPWDDGIVAFNEAMLQDGGDVSGRVLPSQGVPKGQGVPKTQGRAPGLGVAKGEGRLPGQGVPKGQGIPKGQGATPGSGTPDQGEGDGAS
jgi:hypothetical protein